MSGSTWSHYRDSTHVSFPPLHLVITYSLPTSFDLDKMVLEAMDAYSLFISKHKKEKEWQQWTCPVMINEKLKEDGDPPSSRNPRELEQEWTGVVFFFFFLFPQM
jgi:hypothetical protein